MAPAVKRKYYAPVNSKNTSTCTDGVQKDKQALKVKSVKKTSQTKRTKGLHIDAVSEVSSSNTERKSEPLPLDENSKTTQKQTNERNTSQTCQVICSGSKWGKGKRKSFVNEFPKNFFQFKNDNKENAMPSVNCLQTRLRSEKKISIRQHSLNSKANKQSCGEKDTGNCPAAVSGVRNPFRKLMFQESPVARIEGDVYKFDEDGVTTKPRHKKGKRKKMLNLSDEEYIPPKGRHICRPYESGHTKATNETDNQSVHFKRKIGDSGSKTEGSPLSEALPKLINGSIKQANLYDLEVDNSTGNSLQVSISEQFAEGTVANSDEINPMSGDLNGVCHTFHFSDMKNTCVNDEMLYLKPVVGLGRLPFSAGDNCHTSSGEVILSKHITVLNSSNKENISPLHPSISKTWKPTAYVSPKAYVERNCSIEDSCFSQSRTLTETAIANMCKAEDPSNDFKGFTLSKRVCIPGSKFCDSHSSCCNLELCSSEKKKTLESKDVVGENGLKIVYAANVKKINICDKIPILKKTNIVSDGPAARCSKVSKSLVQSDSLSVKEKHGASHQGSFTHVKKMYDDDDDSDAKLHLKPVVCLERLVQPFFTCSNDCTSDKRTTPRNITVLNTSNKENIPTSMHQSMSKTRRQSRKSWRPLAYVSPKAYVEKNDSFENSFDSPFGTMTENRADRKNNECSSLLKRVPTQDSKFCGTRTFVCSAEDVSSSKHSKYAMDLNRLSTCQKTVGISIPNIPLECAATPNQLLMDEKADTCVTLSDVDNSTLRAGISDQFLMGRRVSALHNITVGNNSDSASSSVTVSVNSSKDINSAALLSKTSSGSISLSSSRRDVSFVSKECRIEVRVSRGMSQSCVDQLGECNTDNYFGFDQEEPEEVLLSPIKLLTCSQQPQLNIVTSSTPDHGTSTAQQCVKPWRPALDRVSARSCKQVQSTLHSFLSKSAPQLKRDVGAVTMPEKTVTSISLHHPTNCAQEVIEAVSTPAIFSVDHELPGLGDQEWSSSRQPTRKVYSHPRRARKWKLDSLQEEQGTQVIEDTGENVSRKTAKKRSKKQDEAEHDMKKFLSAINNEFETIENFELCVE